MSSHIDAAINKSNTFEVILRKNARGLGFAVGAGDSDQPLTVKRVFAGDPAALAGLREGDLLLTANDMPMHGLTSIEAVNMLHALPSEVSLIVVRPFTKPSKAVHRSASATSSPRRTPTPVDISRRPEVFDDHAHSHLDTSYEVTLVKKDGE